METSELLRPGRNERTTHYVAEAQRGGPNLRKFRRKRWHPKNENIISVLDGSVGVQYSYQILPRPLKTATMEPPLDGVDLASLSLEERMRGGQKDLTIQGTKLYPHRLA